jgi:hemolysin III
MSLPHERPHRVSPVGTADPTAPFSFMTHAVGAGLAIVGLVLMVERAEGSLAVAAVSVYGASLVLLLASSALHHAVHPATQSGIDVLRRLDHIAIFGLIAGTYTPVSLLGLPARWGWSIFGIVWGLFVGGVVLKVFYLSAPRWLTTALYIAMGWIVLVAVPPVLEAYGDEGLWLLAAGGVVYTVGALVYGMRRPDLFPHWMGFHGLWHLFVLVGAGLHWWFVFAYVLRP